MKNNVIEIHKDESLYSRLVENDRVMRKEFSKLTPEMAKLTNLRSVLITVGQFIDDLDDDFKSKYPAVEQIKEAIGEDSELEMDLFGYLYDAEGDTN